MQTPTHLSSTGVNLTSVQRAMVEEAISDLERFFGPMIACQVAVSVPHRRPGGAPIAWTCRLGLTVPGQILTVSRQAQGSFQGALEDAFVVARRQLEDYAREVRGDVKTRVGEQGPQASTVVAVGPPLPPIAGEGVGIW